MAGITMAVVALGWAAVGSKWGFYIGSVCALVTALGELIHRELKE